jgi:two-component system osmolarity sensor histidine kinase EnvZ
MVNDLERIEMDRTVILAGISHDLRTPLARMQLEIEMAPLSEDAREGMRADLTQMDAIIGQFTNYAKPRSQVPFVPIDLSALLEDAVVVAMRIPDAKITTDITPNLMISGNQTDLERVINNLAENANRYGKTASTGKLELDISCHIEGQSAVLRFSDRGEGVPESELDHMLLPFTRLDSARSQANGSGLGLAIVTRIISRHNGRLSLYNRPNGGLTIQIVFPLLNQNKPSKLS